LEDQLPNFFRHWSSSDWFPGFGNPLLELCAWLLFPVLLRKAQNTIYAPLIKPHQEWRSKAQKGNLEAQRGLNAITTIIEKVGMNLS
jgi:hypothetical protein